MISSAEKGTDLLLDASTLQSFKSSICGILITVSQPSYFEERPGLYCYFAFLTVPRVPIFPAELHLKKMCALLWCNIGDNSLSTKDAFESFRNVKKPGLDYTGSAPFAALQCIFDPLYTIKILNRRILNRIEC